MANLTSTLTMRLIDDVTKPARSVAQALKDAERNAKQVAKAMATDGARAGDKFVKSLSGLKLSAKDIEEVAKSWKDYSKAAGLAAKASDWTKAQVADVRRWESQTISALRSVKREQQAFARSVAAAGTAGVGPIAAAMSANAIANARLKRGMSAPIVVPSPTEMQKAETRARRGKAGSAVAASEIGAAEVAAAGGLLGRMGFGHVAAGYGVYKGAERIVEAGAERQHVRVGARNAGMSPSELRRAEATSIAATKGAPTMSASEVLELFKETRSAVQHPEETFHLIPLLAKAASVLKGMGVQNANIAEIVKGGESLGLMNDPHRFEQFLEGQVKAMQVMGKTITTEQIFEASKYSKSAGATLSDEFLNTVLPSLIQEMHGSSAGDALSMLVKTLRGGMQNKHLPVERLNQLGLLADPSKIRRSKTGSIKGYAGKVVGDDILASDPRRWFQEIFKPAAEKAGIKSLADQVMLLNQTLPSTAANLGRILLQQEETLKQHATNYRNAASLDEAVANQTKDPKAALKEVTSAFDDLGAALTSSAPMGEMLHGLATHIRELSDVVGSLPSFDRMKKAEEEAKNQAKREGRKSTLIDWWHHMDDSNSYANSFEKYKHPFKKVFARHTQHPAFVRRMTSADFIAGPYGSMGGMGVPSTTPTFARMEGVTPHVDAHELDAAKIKAEEAKKAVDGLNETVVTRFDSSSLDAFISKAQLALSLVSKLEAARAGASANLPDLGKVQRGNFSFGGVQGE